MVTPDRMEGHRDRCRSLLRQLLAENESRIFTVLFIKKDGKARSLTGRLGVKGKTGAKPTTWRHAEYVTVFDMQKRAHRTVNLDTIRHIKCGGREIVL